MSSNPPTDAAEPHAELKAWIARVAEIDREFNGAEGWGSRMVMLANEREVVVNKIHRAGYPIGHKYRVRLRLADYHDAREEATRRIIAEAGRD